MSALQIDARCLQELLGRAVMVYPWIDGKVLKCGTVDRHCAEKIGEVLGAMHALNLDASDFKPAVKPIDPERWKVLEQKAQEAEHSLQDCLAKNLGKLEFWSRKAMAVETAMNESLLLTHADLDQQNVIWSETACPALIDWESASLQNPTGELLNLCLDWSGFPERSPSKEAFLDCLRGYRNANAGRTPLMDWSIALDGEIGYLLRWLLFSINRSFDGSPEEKDIALAEAGNALRSLELLETCAPLLLSWLHDVTELQE